MLEYLTIVRMLRISWDAAYFARIIHNVCMYHDPVSGSRWDTNSKTNNHNFVNWYTTHDYEKFKVLIDLMCQCGSWSNLSFEIEWDFFLNSKIIYIFLRAVQEHNFGYRTKTEGILKKSGIWERKQLANGHIKEVLTKIEFL